MHSLSNISLRDKRAFYTLTILFSNAFLLSFSIYFPEFWHLRVSRNYHPPTQKRHRHNLDKTKSNTHFYALCQMHATSFQGMMQFTHRHIHPPTSIFLLFGLAKLVTGDTQSPWFPSLFMASVTAFEGLNLCFPHRIVLSIVCFHLAFHRSNWLLRVGRYLLSNQTEYCFREFASYAGLSTAWWHETFSLIQLK